MQAISLFVVSFGILVLVDSNVIVLSQHLMWRLGFAEQHDLFALPSSPFAVSHMNHSIP